LGIRFIHFKEITLNRTNITSDWCPFLDLDIPIFQGNFNTVLRGIPGKLDETPRVTEIKVRESFEKQLGISNERVNVMLLTQFTAYRVEWMKISEIVWCASAA
jgi:hypothetical protein